MKNHSLARFVSADDGKTRRRVSLYGALVRNRMSEGCRRNEEDSERTAGGEEIPPHSISACLAPLLLFARAGTLRYALLYVRTVRPAVRTLNSARP